MIVAPFFFDFFQHVIILLISISVKNRTNFFFSYIYNYNENNFVYLNSKKTLPSKICILKYIRID